MIHTACMSVLTHDSYRLHVRFDRLHEGGMILAPKTHHIMIVSIIWKRRKYHLDCREVARGTQSAFSCLCTYSTYVMPTNSLLQKYTIGQRRNNQSSSTR